MKLSVLMPVYNERDTLARIADKVLAQQVPGIDETELLMVDDCSTDGSRDIIESLVRRHDGKIRAFFHPRNRGKGASLRTAIQEMTGDVCLVQDADLEYDPKEYGLLLGPILSGQADCVYGSRFVGTQAKRVLFFWHYMGNKFLTLLSNMLTNLNLTDMETCYKAFRSDVLKSIPLRCERFGFEPEVTAKIARKRLRIYEVGISYHGRTYGEGKKITWVDGVRAVLTILRFWAVPDLGPEEVPEEKKYQAREFSDKIAP